MKSRRRRIYEAVLHVVFVLFLGTIVFGWFSITFSRSRLPSLRRTVWLDATRQIDGNWIISQIGEGPELDQQTVYPPPPDSPNAVRICMQEDSKGRTSSPWSAYRLTWWGVYELADAESGWCVWDDKPELHNSTLETSISSFITNSIVPNAKSLKDADTSAYPLTMSTSSIDINWHLWAFEFSRTAFIGTILASLGVAAFINWLLHVIAAIPRQIRRDNRIARGECPECAYPIGINPVCTECGHALPHMEASR